MKRFLPFLMILALATPVFGQQLPYPQQDAFPMDALPDVWEGDYGKTNIFGVYYGTMVLPLDTLWLPGLGTYDSIPATRGINLTQYEWLGFEVVLVQADTTLNDSVEVSLWTGDWGSVDSLIEAVAATQITNGGLFDTCGTFPNCLRATHWFCLRDTAETREYPFQRYAWLRLRNYMTTIFATDTTFEGTPNEELTGDSLNQWLTTNADDLMHTVLYEADFDSFVYVSTKDSLFAVAFDEMSCAESPGRIDSVTFAIAYCESIVVLIGDSLAVGIAFGDVAGSYWDFDEGAGSGILWSATQFLDSSLSASTNPRAKDTVYFTFATDPYGNAWTRSTLDSTTVFVDPIYIGVTGGAAKGWLYIYLMWATTYHSRTDLYPNAKYRATIWLKE